MVVLEKVRSAATIRPRQLVRVERNSIRAEMNRRGIETFGDLARYAKCDASTIGHLNSGDPVSEPYARQILRALETFNVQGFTQTSSLLQIEEKVLAEVPSSPAVVTIIDNDQREMDALVEITKSVLGESKDRLVQFLHLLTT